MRLAVGGAGLLWAAVLLVLLATPGAELRAVLGAALFLAFFACFSLVYLRTSITVTRDGIVSATVFRRRPVPYEDITGMVVHDGLGGRVYAVVTHEGRVQFTSLFARHRELFELIRERAALEGGAFLEN